ncbi:TPA: FKBP-type peptidyl-prolyl cis-trans isomerase [Photobacterium damselae]|uniref:Peptidyl-prolyl cis-trans isomerase n=1 Tax=Photobacterium damselae subsp. damselae TaxID=85581 RepID=A0AAE8V407_PHODD|nr:FKBP-type peptidyl-prolyl cis-trans isomerase [Photobacterium damselae]KAB1184727.1 FKBP-type peptidyl-prolyl cis-trans isomerase [Photobacterium damselae subsp. damselae]MCG3816751.1 FKBP-type peptidyl-prolyl cis-trans isomerase [Photobacterium damselae]MCG9705600.1 FKBP-type peptidyl-prolyl cis-trans isomerase [Photobacterium damselae]NVH48349.1 FKBP-type peptidyl-prolyl cis-trans isomerase [Photobacterium damselae subsp. damselae]NVO74586.1 FKBP-type peptidyl-prolyl cis-trans isomerase [
MPEITGNSEVLIHFTIELEDGSLAESTYALGKPAKFRLGDGSLTPNFEQCLLGLYVGDKEKFILAPEDAFGLPNPNNIHQININKFSAEAPAEVGTIIAFSGSDGQEIPGVVIAVEDEMVTIDFNHPLSGQTITFAVEVMAIER